MSQALASKYGRAAGLARSLGLAAVLVAALAGSGPVRAQGAPPPATLTQPAVPDAALAPIPAPPPSPTSVLPTLVPQAGDPSDVDEVVLPARPVAIVSGQTTWEDGLKNMRAAFARIDDGLAKAGIARAGRPLTVFVETTDENFKFDAMVPIALAPGAATPASPDGSGLRFGTTPSGKAYRFVHKGPYDEIDSTYETITAYLDAKDIVAKDSFIEEYLNDVADPADTSLEINIFVQPK